MINFPTSLDNFTNPLGTQTLDSPDHAGQHSDANDALEALEAKIGVGAGTPTLNKILVGSGNGTATWTTTWGGGTGGGTINNATIGTSQFTGGTINNATIGTSQFTGGTATSQTLAGTPVLDATSATPFYNDSMARQAIINGNFDVWQRGTSIALTAADGYTADRWYVETTTTGTDKTVSRQDGTGVNGSYYCARVAQVADVDETLRFSQALESQDSIKFRGKKVTLSFYARGGAEFVADNSTLISKIVTGKGTDQKVTAFTTSADAISQNNTLTTSWVKFTCTTSAVIAADITQIGVMFAFTHAGAGTTTNYFEVTKVQLCAGDVALPFQPKSYEEELRACQRYCFVPDASSQIALAHGLAISTTVARIYLPLPVAMRAAKAITATAGDWQMYDGVTGFDLTAIAIEGAGSGGNYVSLNCTVAAGLTQFRPYYLTPDATVPRTLVVSSEL